MLHSCSLLFIASEVGTPTKEETFGEGKLVQAGSSAELMCIPSAVLPFVLLWLQTLSSRYSSKTSTPDTCQMLVPLLTYLLTLS